MLARLSFLSGFYRPLGEDIFCLGKKFLVFNLVSRNLKIKYRRSILGLLWTLMTPLAMTAVYYFVFKIVLRVTIPNHLIFILSGILTWNFIAQSILEGMESLVGSIGLVTKVPIPLPVFPLVSVLTNLSTFLLAFPVLLIAAVLSGTHLSSSLILFPLSIAQAFLIVYGVTLSLALLFVILRDLRHIMGIVLQVWFYATPVIYDENMIPAKYSWVLYLNPFGVLFVDLHSIWVRGEWPTQDHLWITSGWCVAMILLASGLQKLLSKGLIERI